MSKACLCRHSFAGVSGIYLQQNKNQLLSTDADTVMSVRSCVWLVVRGIRICSEKINKQKQLLTSEFQLLGTVDHDVAVDQISRLIDAL